jgi:NhaP-type Na+/H+ or K+/H+ antiporter
MTYADTPSPALTIAMAMAVGIVCQVVSRHLRIPGIVLLLGAGVALGPDGLGLIVPGVLGHDLHVLVGFATAVILFEGGLNLDRRRLKREGTVLRRLLTWGAGVTALGSALATHYVLGWSWTLSVALGSLVVVTGPTVVTPLLRRIKVRRELETILEAEGVLIDGIGAILAVVVIEVVTLPDLGFLHGMGILLQRLGFGAVAGLLGGAAIAAALKYARIVPQDLDNPFTLALVLALVQGCNTVMPETGIVAAIVAGMVVANAGIPELRDLREFKEQLTVMLIGMLFVLLAADVRLAEIGALGWAGVATVLLLMFVVRPVAVLASTPGQGLDWRQKAFLAWVAPRGIIAAAVSSLFADRLRAAEMPGGLDLRALVFLVIVMTVVLQGLTARPLALALGLARPSGRGYAMLGAHALARLLAGRLRASGQPVVMIDSNAENCRHAEQEGFRVIYGNALEERAQRGSQMDSRLAAIGLLPNGVVNLRFAERARRESQVPEAIIAESPGLEGLESEALQRDDIHMLFGSPRDVALWDLRVRRGTAALEIWRCEAEADLEARELPRDTHGRLLPLVRRRDRACEPVDERTRLAAGDEVDWLVFRDSLADAHAWLREAGWVAVASPAAAEAVAEQREAPRDPEGGGT